MNRSVKNDILFYRDKGLKFFEIKHCKTKELSYRKHTHDEYSIGGVSKGRSILWYEGKSITLYSNSLMFMPPDYLHACNPDPGQDWEYTMLFIQPDWMEATLEQPSDGHELLMSFKEPCLFHHKHQPMMQELIACLTGEAEPMEKETQLIDTLNGFLTKTDSKGLDLKADVLENRHIKVVKEYLDDNYADSITLDMLAQVSGVSKYHLIRSFKNKYHIPPHTYQLLLRINHAKRELKKQRLISEIAQDVGFYDQSHFNKQFRFFVGTSPEVYQKSVRLK